jgi:acyl-coenzyme A thioesterase PaaI-like protein
MDVKLSPGVKLLQRWRLLQRIPGGPWLFSRVLARMVPYSGSIAARIRVLEPGYARVELPDRRRVRNHLDSIHAVALLNLAELAGGLAMMAALPAGVRGIVTSLHIDYVKKGRGTLIAECHCQLPAQVATLSDDMEYKVLATIRDATDNCVARAEVCWRLGPVR